MPSDVKLVCPWTATEDDTQREIWSDLRDMGAERREALFKMQPGLIPYWDGTAESCATAISRYPILREMIGKLPKSGPWPAEDRAQWLRRFADALQVAYGPDDFISVKIVSDQP